MLAYLRLTEAFPHFAAARIGDGPGIQSLCQELGRGRLPLRIGFCMRSKHPTPRRILEAAAKLGINIRMEFDADGKVCAIQTVGEAGGVSGGEATGNNPWNEVLDEDQKRPS